ncbi:hypothetical protein EVC45_10455 [Paraburkholderia sp. UYCP14C]|uniref:hypothetical protein n=1 Tax=Paraburkholderia sp. UYCP14C TaxID=2511130 RepID=UPI00101E8F1F|nr:hypothetical protein [Paraburkholderia sp. UYCP14C]RZF30006.1 hypothetical protein EVC45_10455 [Paraburkholderia sp. UYCP14C]
MNTNPCIPVPSPTEIGMKLFPNGRLQPPTLANAWTATVLLTPPGGQVGPVKPSDQLAVAYVTYKETDPSNRQIRYQIFLLESLKYFDVLFRTEGDVTSWWSLVSTPDQLGGVPSNAFGPFSTSVVVPGANFLADYGFTHVGSWNVIGRSRDAFVLKNKIPPADKNNGPGGTWVWCDTASNALARVMTTRQDNEALIPIFGAYYLSDFCEISNNANTDWPGILQVCDRAKSVGSVTSTMLTLVDLLQGMSEVPQEAFTSCVFGDIQRLIPGILPDLNGIPVPTWTNQVNSECIMMGQELAPLYCQLWYDWDKGAQVTVFVSPDDEGSYTSRFDEMLPKGHVGPENDYVWDGIQWKLRCYKKSRGFVPMPVPNFVAAGQGRCRAAFKNDPYFSSSSIWSVPLNAAEDVANFWYVFSDQQKGVIFSLSPAASLTLIDYQTFVQNAQIQDCVFYDPQGNIPMCPDEKMSTIKNIGFLPGNTGIDK